MRGISYYTSIIPVVAPIVIFFTIVGPAALADEIARARSLDFSIALALMCSTGPIEGALWVTSMATASQEREKHQQETGWEAHEILTWKT